MARAKRWSELSHKTRDKYAAFGLGHPPMFPSRDAMVKSYNRGSWNPGSPSPVQRIPAKFRGGDWQDEAWLNMRAQLGGRARWNDGVNGSDDEILSNVEQATELARIAMAHATENELAAWAKAGATPGQSDKAREREALKAHPGWKKQDVGYFDSNSKWHSVFWYHGT